VDKAVREGVYAPWTPTYEQVQKLKQIFPGGVCDYSRPDQGRPRKLD
jgi:hypothetical protein